MSYELKCNNCNNVEVKKMSVIATSTDNMFCSNHIKQEELCLFLKDMDHKEKDIIDKNSGYWSQ